MGVGIVLLQKTASQVHNYILILPSQLTILVSYYRGCATE